jgi:hypothetical protein
MRTSSEGVYKTYKAAELAPANPGVSEDLQALKSALSIGWISPRCSRSGGDGKDKPQRGLQDQENLQEVG